MRPHNDNIVANGGGWLAAAVVVALAAGLWGAFLLRSGHFASGGALLIVSVCALRWPRSIWASDPNENLSHGRRTLAVLAVSAVAAFFRVYQIEPPGIWGDDAINGLLAFNVLDGKIASPFQLVIHSLSLFHALSNYAIAGVFWLLGPGPVTLRIPGLIAGFLAVPLLYGTIAPLFGSRVALVAALFLASSPMQLNHNKVLIQIILGQLFLLAGLCLLVRGFTGQYRWLISLAGAPLALCLYVYHAAKIAPLIAVIFVVAMLLKSPTSSRRLLMPLAELVVVFLACSIPAAHGYLHDPSALMGRAASVALWPAVRASHNLSPLWSALWHTLLAFHYEQGPVYNWVGIGHDPALTIIPAFLVVHGTVQSLRRWAEPRHILLLSWVLVGLIPGFLSTEAPRVYRIFLASPPLYVWAALPVVQLYACASQPPRRRWLQTIAALIVLSVPLVDFNYYFYRVYTNREFRWFQAARLVEMARTLKALGTGWTGYVMAGSFDANYETLAFLSRAWGLTLRDVRSLTEVLPVHDEPTGGDLFIVDQGNAPLLAAIESVYPTVIADTRTDPPIRSWWFDRWLPLVPSPEVSRPTVTFFAVSRRVADSLRGITTTFLDADGHPLTTRVDPSLRLDGMKDVPNGSGPATQVKWSGALYAPTDATYHLKLESAADARVWIDERVVVSHTEGSGMTSLAEGLHRFAAEALITEAPFFRLQWQQPGDTMTDIPPALLFRDGNIHGLLAEYHVGQRTLRRVEPYPYYGFFRETFAEPYSMHWRGHLNVPNPGGYRLEVVSKGAVATSIDGHALAAGTALSSGDHELLVNITDVHGAAQLQLFWQRGDASREFIPPSAFTPPLDQ